MAEDSGFLSRWSRRKVQVRSGEVPAEAPPPVAEVALSASLPAPAEPVQPPVQQESAPPPPTLDDVAALTSDSDFSRFVKPDVDAPVRNAAMKKLFSDPHFNVMDGLDTYIDDYGKPDPLPPGMLRQMVQSAMLGLFDDEPKDNPPPGPDGALPSAAASAAAPATRLPPPPDLPPDPAPDEDTALRLQPHDDAGHPGTRARAGEDPGRQL
jgi:hypothetical protein